MLTLKAKWMAEELLDILSEQEYEIHSTFESGFNLRVEDVLCYVGNKYDMRLPYAIILEKEDIHVLNEIENLEIDLSQAVAYSSKMDTCLKNLLEVTKVCEIIIGLIQKEDIPIVIQDLQSRIPMEYIFQALICDDAKQIKAILKQVVGFGTGLTPSGDDFLMGIIYAYQLFGKQISATFLDTLSDMLNHGYTTDASVHYFRCAMRGLYSQPLLDLAKDMENVSWNDQEECAEASRLAGIAMEKLFTFGHTSGRDTAAGIKAVCENLRKGMTVI